MGASAGVLTGALACGRTDALTHALTTHDARMLHHRFERLKETAFEYAFLLKVFGQLDTKAKPGSLAANASPGSSAKQQQQQQPVVKAS
jgi:hypothetical protein